MAGDENSDRQKLRQGKNFDQRKFKPTNTAYFKVMRFCVISISTHATLKKKIIYPNQAKHFRSKTAKSWIFWIYFDIGYDQKVKKNLKSQ